MAFYIDSATPEEILAAQKLGWVTGITTNPVLMSKSTFPPEEILLFAEKTGMSPVYYQLTARTEPEMVQEAAKALGILGSKLILKIPPAPVGFRFVSRYHKNFRCCITAVFTQAQALAAAESGAVSVAVYVNRATRYGEDGIAVVKGISEAVKCTKLEIIAASIKSVDELTAAVLVGSHHVTAGLEVLNAVIESQYSRKAAEEFLENGIGLLPRGRGVL